MRSNAWSRFSMFATSHWTDNPQKPTPLFAQQSVLSQQSFSNRAPRPRQDEHDPDGVKSQPQARSPTRPSANNSGRPTLLHARPPSTYSTPPLMIAAPGFQSSNPAHAKQGTMAEASHRMRRPHTAGSGSASSPRACLPCRRRLAMSTQLMMTAGRTIPACTSEWRPLAKIHPAAITRSSSTCFLLSRNAAASFSAQASG